MSFVHQVTKTLSKIDPVGRETNQYKRSAKLDAMISPLKPVAPTGPTDAEIGARADALAQEEQRRLMRGRTSTMLTGGAGLSDLGMTSKVLLGQ